MGNALAQMAELQPMGTTLADTQIKTKVSEGHLRPGISCAWLGTPVS